MKSAPVSARRMGTWLVFLPLCLAALSACTETPITDVDPEKAPGSTVPTKDVLLGTFQLPVWRDTSLMGFALPDEASFFLLSGTDEFQARALGRFPTIPDSIFIFADSMNVAVDSFLNAFLQVTMDTTASTFPEPPFTLHLFELTRGFDGLLATWTEASPDVPWTTPGGDLGIELGSTVVVERIDTTSIELPAPSDSLLKAWREAGGEPGLVLSMEVPPRPVGLGGTPRPLRVTDVRLGFDVQPEGDRNTLIRRLQFQPGTFIFNPPQPEAGSALRAAGLPAWRFYLEFQLPDTLAGVPLKKSTVNQATLIFRPLTAPPERFVPSQPLLARALEVLGDPFEQGPKTPVGALLPQFLVLDPDSLSMGISLRVDITSLVVRQALSDDPLAPIRIAIRGQPDAQDFGFWDFGSAEAPNPLAQPQVLIVLTPPPTFKVP